MKPEDKARLLIEDQLRDKPTLSPQDRRQILNAMEEAEVQKYNAYIDRYNTLRDNVKHLTDLAELVNHDLYQRDRLLWYIHAVEEIEEHLVFNSQLFNDNPNVKPNKPVIIKTTFADIHLGLNKKREIVDKDMGVKVHPLAHDALITIIERIRRLCGEMKAIYNFIEEEAKAIKMDFLSGFSKLLIHQYATWDSVIIGHDRIIYQDNTNNRGTLLFPVKAEYALVWDDIEPNPESVKRIKADPANWIMVSQAEVSHRFYDDGGDPGNAFLREMGELAQANLDKAKVEMFKDFSKRAKEKDKPEEGKTTEEGDK